VAAASSGWWTRNSDFWDYFAFLLFELFLGIRIRDEEGRSGALAFAWLVSPERDNVVVGRS
jgi:hypothetical protein